MPSHSPLLSVQQLLSGSHLFRLRMMVEQLLSRLQHLPPPLLPAPPDIKDKLFHSACKQPWLWNKQQIMDGRRTELLQGSQQVSPGKMVKKVWSGSRLIHSLLL